MTNAWDFYKPNLSSEYVRPLCPSFELWFELLDISHFN